MRSPYRSLGNFGVCEYCAVAAEPHLLVNIPTSKTAPTALEVPSWGRRRRDRSRRKQSAALLSVAVCDFGSLSRLAGYVRILTKNETGETWKTLRPIRSPRQSGAIDPSKASFVVRLVGHSLTQSRAFYLNLFDRDQTYCYLGHCITRGLSLRRQANILRLGGVVHWSVAHRLSMWRAASIGTRLVATFE